MIGCVYKVLAKVLVNRLKRFLPLIINPFQGAFVANKQILDGILISNELIDSRQCLITHEHGFIFKIDLEKAGV